ERLLSDLAELDAAECAGIVEVNVETDAMARGDPEDHVEMPADIVVDAGGIEPADQIGAVADGLIEEVGSSRVGDDSALGKGDDLDIEEVARRLPGAEERMQPGEGNLGIDVDVASQRCRTVRDDAVEKVLRPFLDRIVELAAEFLFSRDAFGNGVAGRWGWKGRP